MQEWFNWHAWKACVPQKGTGGSNPPLSAKTNYSLSFAEGFLFYSLPIQACLNEQAGKQKDHTSETSMGVIWLCKVLPRGSLKIIPLF